MIEHTTWAFLLRLQPLFAGMSMPSPGSPSGPKRKASRDPLPYHSSHAHHHRVDSSSSDSLSNDEPSPHHDYTARAAALAAQGDTEGSKRAAALAAAQATKRIKTARACDSCRRKKIRCDVIDDGGPSLGDPNNGNGGLTCAHCRQYGFECTFFLPITETRFKKKREREAEELAAAAAASGHPHYAHGMPFPAQQVTGGGRPFLPGVLGYPPSSNLPDLRPPLNQGAFGAPPLGRASMLESPAVRISSTQEWPRPPDSANGFSNNANRDHQAAAMSRSPSHINTKQPQLIPDGTSAPHKKDDPPPGDTRVLGPTSIAYIVHSTAFVPGAAIEEHDLKHHQTFEVGASGNGIIKFHKPPKGAIVSAEDADDIDVARIPESIRGRLAGDVAEKLVNNYFEKIGFLFPVITKSEFLHLSPPPPLLLYAICGVAALNREVPKEVLTAIKITLNGLFRDMDLLSNSNNNTVKALLIMSLHSDMHGSTAVQSGSRCWNRVGAAIRMAQDLGLHRDASGRDDSDDDAYFLEQKRRIWGCCVTADRCMSISLGHPLAIDLTDCDVRLPSPFEILQYPGDLPSNPGEERPFAFNTEMLKLSILFGRVMKTIYSPTGLMKTTDDEIVGLLNDIDRWRNNLPASLQFCGAKETGAAGGILHVSYACLMHLFFRVFMRISYNCPQHLTFSLTIERMTNLIRYSREAIEWVDCNEFYLDTMQFVSYGLVFCGTVQYHAWIRRGDQQALSTLKIARDCVMRFQRQGEQESTEELTVRTKTAQVIKLLHESALGAYANSPNSGNLNPTAGVTNRRTADTVRGIVFKPDETRPGGGVYVATNTNLMLDDLPPGTMVLQETSAGHVPALVRTKNTNGGAWKTLEMQNSQGAANSSGLPSNDVSGPRDLTHVAGGVWADAEGRAVDARGSRLLTMIPVPNGDAMLQQQQQQQQTIQQQQMPDDSTDRNAQPRLSFSAIAGGLLGSNTPSSGAENDGQGQAGASSTSSLNDAAWLSAMAAQSSSASESASLPTSFSFSDLYTFDGQVAHPAQAHSTPQNYGLERAMNELPAHQNGVSGPLSLPNTSTPAYAYASNSSAPPPQSVSHAAQPASAVSTMSAAAQSVDPLALDGMPGGALDFVAWDQWFRGSTSSINTGV